MKRPSDRTMFLGHPVVATPLILAAGGMTFGVYAQGGDATIPGLFLLGLAGVVGKATSEVNAFRQWEREWAAMAGETLPPSRLKGFLGAGLALVLCLMGLGVAVQHPEWLLPGVLLVVALLAIGIVRARRQRFARRVQAVSVRIDAKSSGPAPTVDAAYADLPDHLKRLMGRSGK